MCGFQQTYRSQDDGTCATFENLDDCAASATDNVSVAGVGSSCEWDEDSRTCYMPEPDEDMETSLIISTISLILTLPLEVVIVAVFAAFIVRPTKGAKKRTRERWGHCTGMRSCTAYRTCVYPGRKHCKSSDSGVNHANFLLIPFRGCRM